MQARRLSPLLMSVKSALRPNSTSEMADWFSYVAFDLWDEIGDPATSSE